MPRTGSNPEIDYENFTTYKTDNPQYYRDYGNAYSKTTKGKESSKAYYEKVKEEKIKKILERYYNNREELKAKSLERYYKKKALKKAEKLAQQESENENVIIS
jgi:hypothetical protein